MTSTYPTQPNIEEDFVFDPIVFTDGFRRHKRQLLKIAASLVIISCSLIIIFFKNSYTSESLVYMDRSESPAIISGDFKSILETGDTKFNIFKSQIELLTSDLLMKNLFQRLAQRDAELLDAIRVNEPQELKSHLIPEYLKETDFIAVRAKTETAEDAQKLAQYYVDEYIREANNIRKQPFERKQQVLEEKIQTLEANLSTKADQLKAFQEEEGIVDVAYEGNQSIGHLEELRKNVDTLETDIVQRQAEVSKIKVQLNLDSGQAIASVAKGSDPVYASLASDLVTAENDYQVQGKIYTANHPIMLQLKSKIVALKQKLKEQEAIVTGAKGSRSSVVIRDEVRQNLVGRLTTAETDLSALTKKQVITLQQLSRLETRLGLLPTKQVKFNALNSEVKNIEEILDQLRRSLAEVKLQQSVEKVYVYSPPNHPEGRNFPTQFQLFLFSLIFIPFLTYLCFVLYEQIRQSSLCNLQELEKNFGISVLTVIPWIGSKKPVSLRLEILSNIYNTFALKLKSSNKDDAKKTLLLASLYTQTERNFYALQSLALSLAKINDKVLILDLNLNHSYLRYQLAAQIDITDSRPAHELIDELELAKTPAAMKKAVQSNIYQTMTHPGVHFFDLYDSLEDNFEFFNADGFFKLIETLKTLDYDWILCDSPPLLKGTETFSLVRKMDGVVLLVEKDSHRSQVYETIHHIHQLQGTVSGIALRQSS